MNYKFTDPATHIDLGFGISASNFYETAEYLWENNPNKNSTGFSPNLYMYRHSIELYLKSLIVIIHKKLRLNYKDGKVPYDAIMPYVLVKNGEWRKMTNCHYISTLYKYFEKLIMDHEISLKNEASQTLSTIINPDNQRIVDHIEEYDDNSTYFRYSDLSSSNKNDKESKKHYNRKIEVQDFEDHINEDKPSSIFVVANPTSGEVIEAHKSVTEMPLDELAKDLRNFATYLSGIHAMFRITLYYGY